MVEQRSGEKVITQEDCNEDKIGSGYLTLTNQRLIFEKGEARVATFTKKITGVALDVPLNKIVSVRTEGWLVKKVAVEVSEPSGTKLYKFGVLGTGKWRDTINTAIKGHVASSSM